uniref:Uncharacterized protein n=1 Tax=Arundo donax TaxID=35708 RepID=A0A0A8XS45_ARUDO
MHLFLRSGSHLVVLLWNLITPPPLFIFSPGVAWSPVPDGSTPHHRCR